MCELGACIGFKKIPHPRPPRLFRYTLTLSAAAAAPLSRRRPAGPASLFPATTCPPTRETPGYSPLLRAVEDFCWQSDLAAHRRPPLHPPAILPRFRRPWILLFHSPASEQPHPTKLLLGFVAPATTGKHHLRPFFLVLGKLQHSLFFLDV